MKYNTVLILNSNRSLAAERKAIQKRSGPATVIDGGANVDARGAFLSFFWVHANQCWFA